MGVRLNALIDDSVKIALALKEPVPFLDSEVYVFVCANPEQYLASMFVKNLPTG